MIMETEKTLVVKDVPQSQVCLNCKSCLRLRLMEMGVVPGQKIRLKQYQKSLWTLTILENDNPISTYGLREDEIERILLEEECIVSLA
jgi:Fe2+ transport system protein FeoA